MPYNIATDRKLPSFKKNQQPRLEDIWQKNLESKCKFMEMVTDCHMEVGDRCCCFE